MLLLLVVLLLQLVLLICLFVDEDWIGLDWIGLERNIVVVVVVFVRQDVMKDSACDECNNVSIPFSHVCADGLGDVSDRCHVRCCCCCR